MSLVLSLVYKVGTVLSVFIMSIDRYFFILLATAHSFLFGWFSLYAQEQNPVIFADVPDAAMIRVGETY